MITAVFILSLLTAVFTVVLLVMFSVRKNDSMEESFRTMSGKLEENMNNSMSRMKQELNASTAGSMETLGKLLSESQSQSAKLQQENVQLLGNSVSSQLRQFEERLKTLESTNQQKLEDMRRTMAQQLSNIQSDNAQKLEGIRNTVDEKLQKTLEEKMTHSFRLVSERLEEVYKGLGEMQNLASGVGDLKKVLSNVKTRGILGEIQLGAILSEILAPEQYDTEAVTVPGSRDHVEFAVKLPAAEDGGFIYLPIDSKFPGDTYSALQNAYESGSAEAVAAARKQLETVIKKCAKDISTKYIAPPYTTNFGILFLPFEGLYAEVVNMGMVTDLQRDYHVNIAGPSTMAAMLNSLQMGFQTLQIQKRSNEVWQVLGAVKTEFEKFDSVLASAQNRIRQLDSDLDKLVGVRTRGINRKLREVQQLDAASADRLLGNLSDEE
ncbi:MAG: DNA recombination protein RmuC [Oscillospiraceae bacterium]|nr:DNA recombination protein RmuC [Oscillospiraceae bacterium]